MKATGVVRKIDNLGRVVIPKEVRVTQGLSTGSPVEFYVDSTGIIIKPYQTDLDKRNALTWLDNALSDAVNEEDINAIQSAMSYIKKA
ncbi:AbrB/MazE/SpoVT family DNA-binding domain-containing protein [Rossellomorea sp. BNER]|uniref:AbrB/MazE/SpoVT family DNA-binding domain-containing protein n=1 Tax=Rossellomorea sp. BNER TaxID=2962031 RepID=UPI003AF2219D|nr:AbrB/MazE/SpoVT family DNA-binding domain-containing protein [Rossellomorea sp. BNER]